MKLNIKQDGLNHKESAVYARTESIEQMSKEDQKHQWSAYIPCQESEADLFLYDPYITETLNTHPISTYVCYSKEEVTERKLSYMVPYKKAH